MACNKIKSEVENFVEISNNSDKNLVTSGSYTANYSQSSNINRAGNSQNLGQNGMNGRKICFDIMQML